MVECKNESKVITFLNSWPNDANTSDAIIVYFCYETV